MSRKGSSGSARKSAVAGARAAIVYTPVGSLVPDPRNPRIHNRAQVRAIARSINAFSFNAPILVDRTNRIVAGHGRFEAAKFLGLSEVPVVRLEHLSEQQAKAYMLADNKLTDRSSWDDRQVAVILKELSDIALDFEIEATGFEPPEIDFRIQNNIAGRGRRYRRVVIDEAAFAKNGDNRTAGSTMEIWEKSIKPTLYDYGGEALACSNSAGKDPDNFFYNICTDPQYGFREYHAPTKDNPLLPKRLQNESEDAWLQRRAQFQADLIKDNDPLVYAQEYLAEFVDWSGAAFFSREKLLDQNRPVPYPAHCDGVFAVIDTASKTGTDNDGTAVTFFAADRQCGSVPLLILDWNIVQIEGAILETWLPIVFRRLEELAGACRARRGSLGAFVEDKNSGTILLQQARRRGMPALAIDSKLTAMGKDERALSVSGYVHRGLVKYTEHAFNKVAVYKRSSRNHLLDQVESFRIGDKQSDREDDLLDTFCYGIALALGNSEGF